MKSMRVVLYVVAVVALAVLATLPAESATALALRTSVSGAGKDSNPCTRSEPCLTFYGAMQKTEAGGEIDALDAGDFGGGIITKSITIDGGSGKVASVLLTVANAVALSVQAGPTDVVTLRNISFQGAALSTGPAAEGVWLIEAGALHIEHCTFAGFGSNGIAIKPTTQPAHGSQVFIEDTISQDNGGDGLFIEGAGTNVNVTVSNSRFTGNAGAGVVSGSYSRTTVRNSETSGNGAEGFLAQANAGTANLDLVESLATNNIGAGVLAGGGTAASEVRAANVTLYANGSYGFVIKGNGTIASFGNNNNANGGKPSGIIAQQ